VRSSLAALVILAAACGEASPPPSPDAGASTDAEVDAGRLDGGPLDADVPVPDAGEVAGTVIRVKYPTGARAVSVRGSKPPLSWDVGLRMEKESDDTWRLSLPTLAGEFEFKPLLDDATWSRGPNYRARQGETVQIEPRFVLDAGMWSVRWPTFRSTLLGNTRAVYVYLPPTYLENTSARLPVVYMHDGQNLFDPAASFAGVTWGVPATMDAAAVSGRFREAIVVGVNNMGADRIAEYTPTRDPEYGGGRGDLYLRMLVEELKPQVDAELRTLPGREDTVLAGSSLGGLISSYAGVRHASVFGIIGAFSPSTWWDGRVLLSLVAETGELRPLRVYVDSGDGGQSRDGVTDTRALAAAYRALGYRDGVDLLYVVEPGATHTESAWARRLPGALEFLLGPGR
jgi:predicted alpha/beta superfamily hydrolase